MCVFVCTRADMTVGPSKVPLVCVSEPLFVQENLSECLERNGVSDRSVFSESISTLILHDSPLPSCLPACLPHSGYMPLHLGPVHSHGSGVRRAGW